MIPVIQKQLDSFCQTVWNTHRIRTQKDTLLPDGVPDHIYEFPEKYGLEDCGQYYNDCNSNKKPTFSLSPILCSIFYGYRNHNNYMYTEYWVSYYVVGQVEY